MHPIIEIQLLKIFAVVTLAASGTLWFVLFRDLYRSTKGLQWWLYYAIILVGLAIAFTFVDDWRPHGFHP